jgi:hypothetical protein
MGDVFDVMEATTCHAMYGWLGSLRTVKSYLRNNSSVTVRYLTEDPKNEGSLVPGSGPNPPPA